MRGMQGSLVMVNDQEAHHATCHTHSPCTGGNRKRAPLSDAAMHQRLQQSMRVQHGRCNIVRDQSPPTHI